MEKLFDAGFDVIFSYGYGCCAFEHNICGSKPRIPVGMPDTSKSLPPEFFTNPRCPPSASPGVPSTDPSINIREKLSVESLPTTKDGPSTQSKSHAQVARENKEPDASNGN